MNDSFLWSVEASAGLVDSFRQITGMLNNIGKYFGGGILQTFNDIVSGKMIKQTMIFNAEMRRLGLSMGYTASQARQIQSATYAIGVNTGILNDRAEKIAISLTKMRVGSGGVAELGTNVQMFTDITGASIDTTVKFVGNLSKLGKDNSSMRKVLEGIANVGNKMGLTQEGMESVLESAGELTSSLAAMGASSIKINSMAIATTKLAATFEQVGLSAQRANQWMQETFDPSKFADNIVMMNKLGISALQYQNILQGNQSAQEDMNRRLVKLGSEVKNLMKISPIAATAYAKIWGGGLSAGELIKLSNARAEKDKKDRDMQKMWGESTGSAQKNLDKLNGKLQMFFTGLMSKMERPISIIVDKMTIFFNKVNWTKIANAVSGFIDMLGDFLQTGNWRGLFSYLTSQLLSLAKFVLTSALDLIKKIDWKKVLGEIKGVLKDAIDITVGAFKDTFPEFKGFTNILQVVGNGLKFLADNIIAIGTLIAGYKIASAASQAMLIGAINANTAAMLGKSSTGGISDMFGGGLGKIGGKLGKIGGKLGGLRGVKGAIGGAGLAAIFGAYEGINLVKEASEKNLSVTDIIGRVVKIAAPIAIGAVAGGAFGPVIGNIAGAIVGALFTVSNIISDVIKESGQWAVDALDKTYKINKELLDINKNKLTGMKDSQQSFAEKLANAGSEKERAALIEEYNGVGGLKSQLLKNALAIEKNTDAIRKNTFEAFKKAGEDLFGGSIPEAIFGASKLHLAQSKFGSGGILTKEDQQLYDRVRDLIENKIGGKGGADYLKSLTGTQLGYIISDFKKTTELVRDKSGGLMNMYRNKDASGSKQLYEMLEKMTMTLIDYKGANEAKDEAWKMATMKPEEIELEKKSAAMLEKISANTSSEGKREGEKAVWGSSEGKLIVEKASNDQTVIELRALKSYLERILTDINGAQKSSNTIKQINGMEGK